MRTNYNYTPWSETTIYEGHNSEAIVNLWTSEIREEVRKYK